MDSTTTDVGESHHHVVGVDPGTTESAWVMIEDGYPVEHKFEPNEGLLSRLRGGYFFDDIPIIFERIDFMGEFMGKTTLETAVWTGRFMEAACQHPPGRVIARLSRSDVVKHFGIRNGARPGEKRPNPDSLLRRAMFLRYGQEPPGPGQRVKDGPMVGVTGHILQALALGLVWWDRHVVIPAGPPVMATSPERRGHDSAF